MPGSGELTMYTEYYGLRETPFGLTPNLGFLFKTESYLETLYNIRYGVSQTKGLVVVTGEVGTGKTTTLRSAMRQFNQQVLTVYLFNPYITASDFYDHLIRGLGLDPGKVTSKAAALNALGHLLQSRHAHGLRTVLIVDEAHGLSAELLEEIRLLMNFESGSEKLLQIILCGQPELTQLLNRADLRQLKQRISLRCLIKALNAFETDRYIRFRLKTAGAPRVNLFNPDATDRIIHLSQGIPRIVNNLCDNSLLYGYAGNQKVITREIVDEVAQTLDLNNTTPGDLAASQGESSETVM